MGGLSKFAPSNFDDSMLEAKDYYALLHHHGIVPVSLFGSPDDRASRAQAVDAAIDYAEDHEYDTVYVPGRYGPNTGGYDASAVNFSGSGGTWSGRLMREGQTHPIDVLAFGAAADGPGGADDLAAINAAASRADTNNEQEVHHPPGTYTVSGDPTFPGSTEPTGVAAFYDGSSKTIGQVTISQVSESAVTQHEPFNADQLQGDNVPSGPSPGDILRSTGSGWEHLADTEHGKLEKVVEGTVNAGHPDFTGPHDTTTRAGRASAIQDAIDHAEDNGDLPFVKVPDSLGPGVGGYDASTVNFSGTGGTWTGRMVREGQRADVYDAGAYGAAGDGTPEGASVQAALDAARSDGATRVFFPPGTYDVTDTGLSNFQDVTLIGDQATLVTASTNISLNEIFETYTTTQGPAESHGGAGGNDSVRRVFRGTPSHFLFYRNDPTDPSWGRIAAEHSQFVVSARRGDRVMLGVTDSPTDEGLFRGLDISEGESVFNEDGRDHDFRVESSVNNHAIFVRGSDGHVGINAASPSDDLLVQAETGSTVNMRLKAGSSTAGALFHFDSGGQTWQFNFKDSEGALRIFNPSGQNLHLMNADLETRTAGKGLVVLTPDGTGRYRIRVDNTGSVVTDGPL